MNDIPFLLRGVWHCPCGVALRQVPVASGILWCLGCGREWAMNAGRKLEPRR